MRTVLANAIALIFGEPKPTESSSTKVHIIDLDGYNVLDLEGNQVDSEDPTS